MGQHSVLQFYQGMNSINFETALFPGVDSKGNPISLFSGAALYKELESGYSPQQWINGNGGLVPRVIKSSQYGLPQQYQLLRNIRLGILYTF